jgi:hypothetical protein
MAKFRGSMIKEKYGAVIGQKNALWVILSQSQRRVSPRTSSNGISPKDSVNYSG